MGIVFFREEGEENATQIINRTLYEGWFGA